MRIDRRRFITSALTVPTLLHAMPAAAAGDPPWIVMAGQDSGPSGRWGHGLAFDTPHGRLLIIGGRDSIGTLSDSLWSFDIGAQSWAPLDLDGPSPRSGSAIATALDGSGFYWFGGESDGEVRADLWWFDFAATAWQAIETIGPTPAARTGTRGAIDDFGRFVISHGRNGDRLFDDTWAFDPGSGTWTDISPPPEGRPMARFDHDLLALAGYGVLLLTGGCSEGIGPCPQGDLWSFDPASSVWSDLTTGSGPTPRTGATLAQLGGTMLMVGGLTELGPESDVWRGYFDGGGVGWDELTLVNHGPMGIYRRSLHAMTAAGSEFYVFGGSGVEGALSDLWTFSFDRFNEPEHSLQPGDDAGESDDYAEGDDYDDASDFE